MRPASRKDRHIPHYPLWATLPLTAFVAVLVPVYWQAYGPQNFLWFSDIALFAVLLALWTGNRLVYSMMAVGVLPLELLWFVDFLTLGNLFGIAAYMFEDDTELHLRILSGFHLFIPPLILWMLWRQGYDRRAWYWQIGLTWVVLLASFFIAPQEDNINWVHGLGDDPDAPTVGPPLVHLALYMALVPIAVIWPMHHILKRFFTRR